MKLYMCYANAIDYNPTGIIVANSEEEAIRKFKFELDDSDTWYTGTVSAYEIEIPGHEILLKKV